MVKKFAVFFLTIIIILMSVPTVLVMAEPNEEGVTQMENENSFRASDIPLFVGQREMGEFSAKLKGRDNMLDTPSFRIPSLLSLSSGVVIAAADRASTGADWGKIDIAIRRSLDCGKSFGELDIIFSSPVRRAPIEWEDTASAFAIDPLMVECADGSLVMMFDFFPESKGLHDASRLEEGSGYIELDGEFCLALLDKKSKFDDIEKKPGSTGYSCHTLRSDGWVYDSNGEKTSYYVPKKHSGGCNYETLGDMYFAVGEPDYLDTQPPLIPKEPKEGSSQDIYVGNIYLNGNMPSFTEDEPAFVQKTKAGPELEGEQFSPYATVQTGAAPLRASVTSYLFVMKSYDSGRTWTQPVDINPFVKLEEDGSFLGTAPGNGICLKNQAFAGLHNRLIMPVYAVNSASVVYSSDNGKTWSRTPQKYVDNIDECQVIELENGSILIFGRQEKLGPTPVSISRDGGVTWKRSHPTALKSVRCQKSIITLPKNEKYTELLASAGQLVLAVHPSGNASSDDSRSLGVVTLGEIDAATESIRWFKQRALKLDKKYEELGENENFFGYSSAAILPDGNIGVLYEAYPSGYIVFTSFNLEWLLDGVTPSGAVRNLTPLLAAVLIGLLAVIGIRVGIDAKGKFFFAGIMNSDDVFDEAFNFEQTEEAEAAEETEESEEAEETELKT